MRIVAQRVSQARVLIEGETVSQIGRGLLLLVGVKRDDRPSDAEFLAHKCLNLRVFEDQQGKLNLSVLEIKGEILAVSQFTLYGDVSKGRRPSFTVAAPPRRLNLSTRDSWRPCGKAAFKLRLESLANTCWWTSTMMDP